MSSDHVLEKRWDAARYQAQHSYVWQLGEAVLDLLAPRAGERIVDLGCGSGQLTNKIAETGAAVIGIDASAEMIAEARGNFPQLDFRVANAESFQIGEPADAVFSNAALHWVKDQRATAASIYRALRPGGRFAAEFGGKGNIAKILAAAGGMNPWFFPSVGEYSTLLEQQGFEVRFATLFDRPTRVEGENGMEDWLRMFAGSFVSDPRAVAERLRGEMFSDGAWVLDYRRIRVLAVR